MFNEILFVAERLKADYDNTYLSEVKKRFSIFYICSSEVMIIKAGNNKARKEPISCIIIKK